MDVFEIYAPVVSWITVRLLLVLSILMELCNQQVDYTNAFCQAPLYQTVYVGLPRGFEQQGMVLELQQSVYGLRQRLLNVYRRLRQDLESIGFAKSDYDECLFNNGEVIILFWVDDCIFYSKSKDKIDRIVESLKDEFLLKREENMAGFLGLNIQHSTDKKTVTLTQVGLIERILQVTGIDDSNHKLASAETTPLCKDIEGEPCQEAWNYRSVVEMMLYLPGVQDQIFLMRYTSVPGSHMDPSAVMKWLSNI